MLKLPPELADACRAATSLDVRVRSFGRVERVRPAEPTLENWIGTLADQRIFGPTADLCCACGKHQGAQHAGMACGYYKVRITSRDVRRTRFGHIELGMQVPHPFVPGVQLEVFPVLPGDFFDGPQGDELAAAYEALVLACDGGKLSQIQAAIELICRQLLPMCAHAHRHNLPDAVLATRGLALKPPKELPGDSG